MEDDLFILRKAKNYLAEVVGIACVGVGIYYRDPFAIATGSLAFILGKRDNNRIDNFVEYMERNRDHIREIGENLPDLKERLSQMFPSIYCR